MHTLPARNEMYEAILQQDRSYDGIFFTCVRTTGIFCRPICSARKPKKENVEFVRSAKEALALGYRPCKRCSPLTLNGSTPDWISQLLQEVESQPEIKVSDIDLQQRGLHPNRVRRWFLKHHQMTFHAYQRALRISHAFGTLRQHKGKVTDTAFASGYDSLSGFGSAFKTMTGFSPKESASRNLIMLSRLYTPLGPMLAGSTENGICLLEFTDRKSLEKELKDLAHLLSAQFIRGTSRHLDLLASELQEYFAGKRKRFTVQLEMPGSKFQQCSWRALQEIPFGHTRTYKQQAIAIGNANAVRAVARANGQNRIAIVIPCHRVIGSDGSLTGYGGGLQRKKFLLDLETGHGQQSLHL